MRPEYISPELFHFFGRPAPADHERNYDLMKLVLKTGCISHPPHEVGHGKVAYTLDLSGRLANEGMLVPTVTCYCDIPYALLGPHLQKYGEFGISFSRHHLTKSGARPVTYVPCRPDDWRGVFTGHTLLKELESTFQGIYRQRRHLAGSENMDGKGIGLETLPANLEQALSKAEHALALRVLAYLKPYDSTLQDSDPNYYYSEREWRKLGNFLFESTDVVRIVVNGDYVERARAELPEYTDRIFVAPRTNAGSQAPQ